jgi:hypothetical protein
MGSDPMEVPEVVLGVSGIIAKFLASTIKPIIKSIIDKF